MLQIDTEISKVKGVYEPKLSKTYSIYIVDHVPTLNEHALLIAFGFIPPKGPAVPTSLQL